MINKRKEYRCPYCNGRLFDYIKHMNEVGINNCLIIIKCWKCHANVKISYVDLV